MEKCRSEGGRAFEVELLVHLEHTSSLLPQLLCCRKRSDDCLTIRVILLSIDRRAR
jgi:hypothetical protein